MHYLDIFFEKRKTHGTPVVVFDETGANGLGKFIQGKISGNRQHIIFKGWKYLDIHGMSHKKYFVCKIHEGFKG